MSPDEVDAAAVLAIRNMSYASLVDVIVALKDNRVFRDELMNAIRGLTDVERTGSALAAAIYVHKRAEVMK